MSLNGNTGTDLIFFDNFDMKLAAGAFKFRPKTDITTGVHYTPQKWRTARNVRMLGESAK